MVIKFCFFKLAVTHNKYLSAKNAFTLNVFWILPGFQELTAKKAALILGELVLKCIEEAIPLPWASTIESLVSKEKQNLKL